MKKLLLLLISLLLSFNSFGETLVCSYLLNDEIKIADLNFSVRNTSYSTLLYSNDEINLLSFNELPHLKEDMITFV
jgi:hypothetical protein